MMFTILMHIYYPDSWSAFFHDRLLNLKPFNCRILVNICNSNNNIAIIRSRILTDFPDAVIISTPNQGKDIGGKLALIDMLFRLELNPEYVVFLHDKKSPHALEGERWRNSLLRIIQPDIIRKTLELFKKNPQTGVVASAEMIANEYDFDRKDFISENRLQLKQLMEMFEIQTTDYRFVTGTMFWIRFSLLQTFFQKHPPLRCRQSLEKGNIMDEGTGTFTHAWERLLCWIVTARHYEIRGV